MPSPHIATYDTLEALVTGASEKIESIAAEAIAARGRFAVALSGGTTPRALYGALADRGRIDWSKTHFFWSDERCVLPSDPQSNYRMAKESLLSRIGVPDAQIHRVGSEEDALLAAQQYEDEIRDFFGAQGDVPPSFDLILLGMGDDGHTASLFPGTEALEPSESWVADNFVKKLNTHRITFTLPLINQAHHVLFLVTGKAKGPIVTEILRNGSASYPAGLVRPVQGQCTWFLDKDAAPRP